MKVVLPELGWKIAYQEHKKGSRMHIDNTKKMSKMRYTRCVSPALQFWKDRRPLCPSYWWKQCEERRNAAPNRTQLRHFLVFRHFSWFWTWCLLSLLMYLSFCMIGHDMYKQADKHRAACLYAHGFLAHRASAPNLTGSPIHFAGMWTHRLRKTNVCSSQATCDSLRPDSNESKMKAIG